MNRSILSPVLCLLALGALIYAIYRSTGEKVIDVAGARQTIYNEPQHGLILGLCIFAGLCVLGAVALLFDRNRRDVHIEDRSSISRRIP